MKDINDSKKHIAMYIGSLSKGGAEHVMCNLAEYFFLEGYKVTIVTTYYEDDEYELSNAFWKRSIDSSIDNKYLPKEVINSKDMPREIFLLDDDNCPGIRRVFSGLMPSERKGRLYNFLARTKKLENIWADIKPDLILSFIGKNNIMAIRTAKKFGIPVVVSVRANPPMEYYTKTLKTVANKLFPKASGVILQTSGAAEFFDEKVREKCHVLPNSVSEEFILRDVVPFENRAKTIVSVGRLDDNKNQKILIRAFGRLMDKYPDYKLMIIGDGDCRVEYEQEAENTSNPGRIEFTGNISNVADRISDAKIYALTSKEEGLPNALIEAMALGLVAISTDCPCGGPADIISDGDNGILIPMGTNKEMEESLVSALDRVMSDEPLAKRLSENALSVREKYSPARINALWKDYFEKVMSDETAVKKNKIQTLTEYIKQFISFGLIGGLNTILSLGIYWLVIYLGGHYLVGSVLGFVITVAISYVLNNLFTFKGDAKPEWSLRTLIKVYASYALTGLILHNILLLLWVEALGINENLAPILNLFFTIPLNFILNKLWAYKKK
jgi:glycosyltransferase involved in cell wall biosynthesis/putative flippase GtrA